jgi:hypothetical protein
MTDKKDAPALFDLESAYLDIDAIEGGKWLSLGADFPGVEIFAKGLSSPEAKKLQAHLERTATKDDRLSSGALTNEAFLNIQRTVIARKCVTDWRGLASGGKPLPFSVETLEGILKEPRARPLAIAIVNAITDLERTKAQQEAAVTGN